MGLLVNGQWQDKWYATDKEGGHFVRPASQRRDWVGASKGSPSSDSGDSWPAQAGRYHLYVSLACPWAHRTLIVRALKGLQDVIGLSVVEALMGGQGWQFGPARPDHLGGHTYLHQVYTADQPDYSGRVTVPVLWDKTRGAIVNNESSEIIRMLTGAWDEFSSRPDLDLYPAALRDDIDAVNDRVYGAVNNGVYKAGFATTQDAYEQAVVALFDQLDALELTLSRQPFLVGDRLTEADIRLFTTLLRFDPVYVGHFKCNLRRLIDYPALWAYTRALYQVPEIRQTCDLTDIKSHYHRSHPSINPHGIVPLGPLLDLDAPHDRGVIRL